MGSSPVLTFKIHEYLRPKVIKLLFSLLLSSNGVSMIRSGKVLLIVVELL